MGLLSRILRPLITRAAEGEPRPGPWWLPITGGWLPADVGGNWNWWQLGEDVQSYSPSALVEACVGAYAQTVAMCPGDHWRTTEDGGRERVTTSALSRILRVPNAYQSISDFMLNTTRSLYVDGNAYALGLRNDRFEFDELHLMNAKQCQAMIAPETGDIFYALGGNEVIEAQVDYPLHVPARDVLHIRLHGGRYVLRGESPLMAVARDIATNDAMAAQQLSFYLNQARPSTVLTTDLVLDKDQVQVLRDRWNEQSRGLNRGGTPILTAGLKPQTLATNAEDAQLAEIMKLSEQRIALAFRVPLQILGLGGASFGSTELLMQSWIATGLGFCLNHIEEAIGRAFQLKGVPDEYVEFDTSALLRSAEKDRIEALVRGVQGGIMSPNEARRKEGYAKVKFGDEPRVQQQVVPLSAASGIPTAPGPEASPAAAAAPAPKPAPPAPPSPEQRGMNDARERRTRRRFRQSLERNRIGTG